MKDVAIFYPEQYEAHIPSFALEQVPEPSPVVQQLWYDRIYFHQAFGRSLAYIEIDDYADLYGSGEVTGRLQRNGNTTKFWNTDNLGYERDKGQRLYQSHPWVLGVRQDGTAFGILADNIWKQEVSLGEAILFSSQGPPFRLIVIEKKTPQEVVKTLAGLTGTIPLPPLWSLGYHQSRWSYYPDKRVKTVADTFRRKNIPCDVIWIDIHYMEHYKIFTFSPESFPHPQKVNDYLHERGFKSVWMIDPGVKVEEGYGIYETGRQKDVWVKTAEGDTYIGKVWPGDCVFPDFTQPKTRKWWADLYMDFMAHQIDGVWNDMNEPSVFNGPDWTMPVDNRHLGGEELPPHQHLAYHNVYGLLMVKASREGIQRANPDKRPFILTRSNFIGGQRYAATWTGDNQSTWKHLKMSVPMSLNLGLSGQPFNGPDIGGFQGTPSADLFAHWMALGAFYPFCRNHTMVDTNAQEPWAFGKKIEEVARKALQRRYRLLPYLYTLFYEASQTGMPVMRPVFFADPVNTELRSEDQAFLVGSDLLVIPKWAEQPQLPEGNWRSISLAGEDSQKDPYHPDIKIRPGAIIPACEIIQSTSDYSVDLLSLYIHLDDKNEATGQLYYDAGDGFGYQNGAYALVNFNARQTDKREIIVEHYNQKGQWNIYPKRLQICWVTAQKTRKKTIRSGTEHVYTVTF